MDVERAIDPDTAIELIERVVVELDEMLRASAVDGLGRAHREEIRAEIARLRRRQQFFRYLRWERR